LGPGRRGKKGNKAIQPLKRLIAIREMAVRLGDSLGKYRPEEKGQNRLRHIAGIEIIIFVASLGVSSGVMERGRETSEWGLVVFQKRGSKKAKGRGRGLEHNELSPGPKDDL